MTYKHIGKIKKITNIANNYYELALSDEEAGDYLAKGRKYRQAMYFYIQAMEKYIKAKIFSKVNAKIEYFSEKSRHHSINESIKFLVEVISSDDIVKEQIKQQIETHVLQGIKFNKLHNQLRYPTQTYSGEYICLEYTQNDCNDIKNALNSLKTYLNNFYKVN